MATASLPMYDMPATTQAYDLFWKGLSKNLRKQGILDVPDQLTRGRPVQDLWDDPDLLISQCCGFDVIARYKEVLRPVATPWYSAQGCAADHYCSQIVVHKDSPYSDVRDMKGLRAAINGPESHSGMSALRHLIAQRHGPGIFFGELLVSGSHAGSLTMIQNREADVASIDSVTFTLMQADRPDYFKDIKTLGVTYTAPAPPFVVQASMAEDDVTKVRAALQATFADPELKSCRQHLLLSRLTNSNQDDYWLLEAFHDHALKRGFSMVQ